MAKAKYWKLPGGRYGGITARGKRFIVDSLAKAKAKLGRKTTRRTGKSKPGRKRGGRRMARRKKRRGGKSMTRTAFKMIRLGALAAGGVGVGMRYHKTEDKVIGGLLAYAGCDWKGRVPRFSWEILGRAWTPYVVACAITLGVPKLTSILRRL